MQANEPQRQSEGGECFRSASLPSKSVTSARMRIQSFSQMSLPARGPSQEESFKRNQHQVAAAAGHVFMNR